MSTPSEQLHLPLGPETAHILDVTSRLTDAGLTHRVDVVTSIIDDGFDTSELAPDHYYTREDGLRLPVHDAYQMIKIRDGINNSSILMKYDRPTWRRLRVKGNVLDEACEDERFYNAARAIMNLASNQDGEAVTHALLIGDVAAQRLQETFKEHYGDYDIDNGGSTGLLAMDGLAYIRSYNKSMQPAWAPNAA